MINKKSRQKDLELNSISDLSNYLEKVNYQAGTVVSLLRVLHHSLNVDPDDPNVIAGCGDLVEKIVDDAIEVMRSLDSVNFTKILKDQ